MSTDKEVEVAVLGASMAGLLAVPVAVAVIGAVVAGAAVVGATVVAVKGASLAFRGLRYAERRARQATLDFMERRNQAHAAAALRQLEERYTRAMERLDSARLQFADLDVAAAAWMPPPPVGASAAVLSDFCQKQEASVQAFEERVSKGITEAQRRLARRNATTAAWQQADDACRHLRQQHQLARAMADEAGQALELQKPMARPADNAELEEVNEYLTHLKQCLQAVAEQIRRLEAQRKGRNAAIALAGAAVHTESAQDAITAFERRRASDIRRELMAGLHQTLADIGRAEHELPAYIREELNALIKNADLDAFYALQQHIYDWQAAQQTRAEARLMAENAPEGAHATPELSRRWMSLRNSLLQVACGHGTSTLAQLGAQYIALAKDAQDQIRLGQLLASYCEAAAREGIVVVDGATNATTTTVAHTLRDLDSKQKVHAAAVQSSPDRIRVRTQILAPHDESAALQAKLRRLSNSSTADGVQLTLKQANHAAGDR